MKKRIIVSLVAIVASLALSAAIVPSLAKNVKMETAEKTGAWWSDGHGTICCGPGNVRDCSDYPGSGC